MGYAIATLILLSLGAGICAAIKSVDRDSKHDPWPKDDVY
jgi:hypothetical protein